jgi:hypothetical protein
MKHAIRNLKHKPHTQRPAAAEKKSVRTGPNWAMLVVVGVFTALVTFGLFEYVLLSKVPLEMLGKWAVVAADNDPEEVGTTLEFSRDGSVVYRPPNSEDIPGTARFGEDRLSISIANRTSRSKPAIVMSFIVVSLTDSHMELEKERMETPDGAVLPAATLKLERPSEKK